MASLVEKVIKPINIDDLKKQIDKKIKSLQSGDNLFSAEYAALDNAAAKEKSRINATADEALNTLQEEYDTNVAEVKQGYEDAYKRNATQRAVNERYLERKAAEMGLTDSGLNRTQQTANQLSYANQKAALDESLIKDVNTLSAAMKARKNEINTQKENDLATVDVNLESSKAQIQNDYYSAESENTKEQQSAINSLISKLNDEKSTNNDKRLYIENYIETFGVDSDLSKVMQSKGYVVLGNGEIASSVVTHWRNQTEARNAVKAALSNKRRDFNSRLGYFVAYVDRYGVPSADSIKYMLGNSGITIEQLMEAL